MSVAGDCPADGISDEVAQAIDRRSGCRCGTVARRVGHLDDTADAEVVVDLRRGEDDGVVDRRYGSPMASVMGLVVGLIVFVTPHVHFRRNFVSAVLLTVRSRQLTVTAAVACWFVSVILATLLNVPASAPHEKVCVGLNVLLFGLVTAPSATSPPALKLSVTCTVSLTLVCVAVPGSTWTAALLKALFVPVAVGFATAVAVFVRNATVRQDGRAVGAGEVRSRGERHRERDCAAIRRDRRSAAPLNASETDWMNTGTLLGLCTLISPLTEMLSSMNGVAAGATVTLYLVVP